jgi:nitrogen fixation protein NifZ
MGLARREQEVELVAPPRFRIGDKVRATKDVRNDGTYPHHAVGDTLICEGDGGYVRDIGTFVQQFYIYAVDFFDRAMIVGMRGKELVAVEDVEDTEVAAPAGAAAPKAG